MSTQKVLVIGATGTVGSLVVHGLLADATKPDVRILTRDKSHANKFGKVEVVEGEYTDDGILDQALNGVNRVFLLTLSRSSQPKEEENVAVRAKKAGVRQLVKISVYGATPADPTNSLFRWHYDAENTVITTGIPTVILRPNLFLQNFSRDDAQSIKTQGVIYKPAGDYRISLVDVRDIADVAVKVLTEEFDKHNGNTYYITGPESLTNEEVAKGISEVLLKPVKLVPIDDAALFGVFQQRKAPPAVGHMIVKLFQNYRTNSCAAVQGDVKLVTGKEARSLKNYFTDHKHLFV